MAARIVWTLHAQERQRAWEERLGITREEVESVLRVPEQVLPGDRSLKVAQARRGQGLLRVVFAEAPPELRVVTLYWTSKIDKYWQEE